MRNFLDARAWIETRRLSVWVAVARASRLLSSLAVAILFCAAMVGSATSTRIEVESSVSVKGEKHVGSREESELSIVSARRTQRAQYASYRRHALHGQPPSSIRSTKPNAPRSRWPGPRRTNADDDEDDERIEDLT